jgi:hypothetical protein
VVGEVVDVDAVDAVWDMFTNSVVVGHIHNILITESHLLWL